MTLLEPSYNASRTSTLVDNSICDDGEKKTTIYVVDEKRLLRKLDLHLIPLFCAFYFVDFLDRSNIGNATLAGLQKDLQLTGPQLSTAISAFFVTYIMFQVPSNMLLERIGARWWLSSIMLAWALVTFGMAFTRDFASLTVTRLCLGAAESGYIPGILYQLSRIYKPNELGKRVSILLCMAALSGIASGPIAFASSHLEDLFHGRLHGWQYLFITEGTITVLLSLVSFCVLFNDVDQVRWLTDEEKEYQRQRMLLPPATTITAATFKTVLTDWKTWLFSLVFMLSSINMTSITVFSPLIIDGLGFPVLTTELLTAPPCVVAALLVLVCGFLADRGNKRTALVVSGSLVVSLGYLLHILLRQHRWASYGAIFIIAAGIGIEGPIGVSWSAINFSEPSVRAVAVAMVTMTGNLGSVVASYLYTVPADTRHVFGNAFNLGCGLSCAVLAGLTGALLYRNRSLSQKSSSIADCQYYY